VEASEEFWAKMGVGFIDHDENAKLGWREYSQSRNKEQGQAAPEDPQHSDDRRRQAGNERDQRNSKATG